MLRGAPGSRVISPAFSSVSTIWWTDGAVTPKWRRMSVSGGLFEDPTVGVDEGQVLALQGREAGWRPSCVLVNHLTHLMILLRLRSEEVQMTIKFCVDLSQEEREQLEAMLRFR